MFWLLHLGSTLINSYCNFHIYYIDMYIYMRMLKDPVYCTISCIDISNITKVFIPFSFFNIKICDNLQQSLKDKVGFLYMSYD